MRDLAFLAILSSYMPVFFIAPHVGVLVWVWLGAMNPHQMVWGFASSLPVVMMTSALTMVAWAASNEKKSLPLNAISVLMIIFICWTSITTLVALSPDNAWFYWNRAIKSLIAALVVIALINSKVRIHALIWVLSVSLGWYGVKAGLYTLATGGSGMALGPPDSMIGDRNHFALAMCMTLPLLNYLRENSGYRLVRLGLLAALVLTVIAVLGTQSRGGFVALTITLFFFWLKSNHKVVTAVAGMIFLIPAVAFMPQEWVSRMETIQTAQEDSSFQGRLDAWQFAINVASARPIFSGGFGATYDRSVFTRYAGNTMTAQTTGRRAAHSIYFEVLGDHGFIGLAIFVGLIYATYHQCAVIRRRTARRPDLKWAGDLAGMMQVSLVAYAVAGGLVSMGYYETIYVMIAAIASLRHQVEKAINPQRFAKRPLATAAALPSARDAAPQAVPGQAWSPRMSPERN